MFPVFLVCICTVGSFAQVEPPLCLPLFSERGFPLPGGAFFGPVWRAVQPHALAGAGAAWRALVRRQQHPTPEPSPEPEEVPEAELWADGHYHAPPELRAAWGALLRAHGLPPLAERSGGGEEPSEAPAPPREDSQRRHSPPRRLPRGATPSAQSTSFFSAGSASPAWTTWRDTSAAGLEGSSSEPSTPPPRGES